MSMTGISDDTRQNKQAFSPFYQKQETQNKQSIDINTTVYSPNLPYMCDNFIIRQLIHPEGKNQPNIPNDNKKNRLHHSRIS